MHFGFNETYCFQREGAGGWEKVGLMGFGSPFRLSECKDKIFKKILIEEYI